MSRALITGGSAGLGRALAAGLAAQRAHGPASPPVTAGRSSSPDATHSG